MHSISVITVVKNSSNTIGNCIESVLGQEASAEYVIIDGSSSDDTIDIIKSYGSRINKFISEPDGGMYDALNKGIRMAEGDIITILHADDVFAHKKVLSEICALFEKKNVDSCYGDLLYVKHDNLSKVVRYWRAGLYNPRRFYWGWMPPHPTFSVKKSVYEKYGLFDTALGSAADYELMLRFLLRHGISCDYIPDILINMRVGGQSNVSLKNRFRANLFDRQAWKVNGLRPYPWTLFLKPLSKIGQYFSRPLV